MKPTQIVQIEGVFENNYVERRSCYWFPSPGMSHVVSYRRFYVPGLDDAAVKIDGVYLAEHTSNALRTPLKLDELNAMLQVFQWPRERVKFLVQTRSGPLYLEAEVTVERPFWERHLDDAYRGWLKENRVQYPTMSDLRNVLDGWSECVRQRIVAGHMLCEIHACDEPAVVGTLRCAPHRDV